MVVLFLWRETGDDLGQRGRILTQIWGYQGWKVTDVYYEGAKGERVVPFDGFALAQGVIVVLAVARRWEAACGKCGAVCRRKHTQQGEERRWADLSWAGRPVVVEYAPQRVRCRCGFTGQERLPFAEKLQRQTIRLQQELTLESSSMPTSHVAAKHALDWHTVRRAEECGLTRWLAARPPVALRDIGVDEKYLGRRRKGVEKFVTIVSNNETGEPLWIGFGRSEATLAGWIKTLTKEQKAGIRLFVTDMHRAFENAVRADPDLAHVVMVHDVFHVMKRAGQAMDELRREIFFRAGPKLRAVGKGKRWLLLRAWERTTEEQRAELKAVFRYNDTLARFYQVVEELRGVLHAPDRASMAKGIFHILLRTEKRRYKAIRSFHDSLQNHEQNLYGLADHRPATGRVEALNNNWETLVRRGRGYRDLTYLLIKLRFATVNPVRTDNGVRRFIALGLPPPLVSDRKAA